jgi:hypothetical protein
MFASRLAQQDAGCMILSNNVLQPMCTLSVRTRLSYGVMNGGTSLRLSVWPFHVQMGGTKEDGRWGTQ